MVQTDLEVHRATERIVMEGYTDMVALVVLEQKDMIDAGICLGTMQEVSAMLFQMISSYDYPADPVVNKILSSCKNDPLWESTSRALNTSATNVVGSNISTLLIMLNTAAHEIC
jgi:hypothetical protein